MAFRYLTADQHPTFTPLARFRLRNLTQMDAHFLRALRLCHDAGMVEIKRVALDGTKVKASASKHKVMSHRRMFEKEKQLDEDIRKIIQEYFRKIQETDEAEDREFGEDNNHYHSIPGVKNKQGRLEKIRAAKKALGRREIAKTRAAGKEDLPVDPKAQINFTDADSRIMPDGANHGSFVQANDCQAMVDEKAQIVVAAETTQSPNDKEQRVPMVNATFRITDYGSDPSGSGCRCGISRRGRHPGGGGTQHLCLLSAGQRVVDGTIDVSPRTATG